MQFTRRTFLAGMAAATAAAVVPQGWAVAAARDDGWATLIDLTPLRRLRRGEAAALRRRLPAEERTQLPRARPGAPQGLLAQEVP